MFRACLKRGYTLLEMLAVCMIIGLISSIGYMSLMNILERIHKMLGV